MPIDHAITGNIRSGQRWIGTPERKHRTDVRTVDDAVSIDVRKAVTDRVRRTVLRQALGLDVSRLVRAGLRSGHLDDPDLGSSDDRISREGISTCVARDRA